MFGRKNEYLQTSIKLSESELNSAARELALYGINRGRKARKGSFAIQSFRKELSYAYRQLLAQMRSGSIQPGVAETLMENHYVVDKAQASLAESAKQLSRSRYTVFANGRYKGVIRVYALCSTLLSCCGYNMDYALLSKFLKAFQEISPLDEGEISLIPLMLKIACVEKAAQLYSDINALSKEYISAERIYEKLTETQSMQRRELILDSAAQELNEAGRTRLCMILSENDEFLYIEELKKRLSRLGKSIAEEAENDRAYQLSLSEQIVNTAGTLKFADGLSTDRLLEDFSMLGRILREDSIYVSMDMPSKRAYAQACSEIASKLHISQAAVAHEAQKLSDGKHLGYWLIDKKGKNELIRSLGGKAHEQSNNAKIGIYIAVQTAITAVIAALCATAGLVPALAAVFPAFIIVNTVVIRIYCSVKKPVPVPRIAVEKISPEKVIVAVSVLLTDEKSLCENIERLETHYLAGNLKNSYYAILGDFKDSKSPETTDEESSLAELAKRHIELLNEKYAKDGENVFFFLLRKRTLNKADGTYMGRERKRGAISDLFRLLRSENRGEAERDFALITSPLPQGIKYALLCDSDTVLTKGVLAQMMGAALHPLNRAVVEKSQVVSGYGIFVPRMERLPGFRTEFMRAHSGTGGVTSYSSLVSDFYHDFFGEAVFGGKGLVDIAAFCECTEGRIDDNTVLSHDMLESSMTRSAYMSDVIMYDSEPAKVFSWWKREHRWIRGDWQLLPYLFAKKGSKKHLNALSRWKIFDNLRRSLSPNMIVLTLWILPFYGFGAYLCVGIAAAFADSLLSSVCSVLGLIRGNRISVRELGLSWERSLLDFMSLPVATVVTIDAVIRTLYRLLFSHKLMLQWQTAAQGEKGKDVGAVHYYLRMWSCVWVGTRLLVAPLFGLHGSLVLGILFLYAPFALHIADAEYREEKLPEKLREYYYALSYDIWCFFQNEASEENGFIPPDNVQVYPYMPAVCNCSPTNIGMGIMAAVSAYDLGFIDEKNVLHRMRVTVDKLKTLEKWNGHLFNWYDTVSGKKLEPAYVSTVDSGNLCACLMCAAQLLTEIGGDEAMKIAGEMSEIVHGTDFSVLFDKDKNLFYIGYDVTRCTLTQAWYDLLASEARLTYLVACALDAIPQKAWFAMGRVLTKSGDSRALISWSGTMFEYLMPIIFTGRERDTLMDETCKAAVDEHIACGGGKPWGISESGYYAFDRSMFYQYRAFGAPALGLAPMKAYEDVRAPYAAVLAAMIYPDKAYENLNNYEKTGARGKYGFFEAVDYTEGRVQEGNECEIVRSFMAHHQGMSICALDNVLNENIIAKRFTHIPEIRTVIIYNGEKLPDSALTLKNSQRMIIRDEDAKRKKYRATEYVKAGRYPRGTFLTNGRMTAFLTDSGISYIKLGEIYLSRFRRDYVRGKYGLMLYLRSDEKVYCINTYDAEAEKASQSFTYESFSAQSELKTEDFSVKTESIVMQNEDVLCMKINIANHALSEKKFELGAFCEMSMAQLADDMAHPAFVRLTVDAFTDNGALYFRRRGTKKRKDIYLCAGIYGGSATRFSADGLCSPGRQNSYVHAMHGAMYTDMRIKSPVEPIMCARNEFTVGSGESREIMFMLGASADLEKLKASMQRASEADFGQQKSLAFAMDMSSLHFMGISAGKAQLLTAILLRAVCGIRNRALLSHGSELKSCELYKFGISGDLPIILTEISNPTQFRLLKAMLSLVRFASSKGEKLDLVIIGRYEMSYRCDVKSYITDTLATFTMGAAEESARIHFIDGYNLSDREFDLLMQSAHIVIDSTRSLSKQFADEPHPISSQKFIPQAAGENKKIYGGAFASDGEYITELERCDSTPLPYSNVICNPQNEQMGTLVTESGGGYTWYGNCHDMRLTPWFCDAMHDMQGEIVLISDDEGQIRSVCHGKLQGAGKVKVRHGFGYSVFENEDALCKARMTVFTDTAAPQKLTLLELTNATEKEKKLKLRYIIDRQDIRGTYAEFSDGIAYLSNTALPGTVYSAVTNVDSVQFSGDREAEFLLYDEKNNVNTGGFSCLTCDVRIRPHEKRDIVLILGTAEREKAYAYAESITSGSAYEKLAAVKKAWAGKLDRLSVKTPDISFDNMVNKRLLYQVYASRLMGRTGFYQSGGAMGFRDQLQDILALLYTDPERAKGQILLCASMQYEAGDVMHWWHKPTDGVRTRITDDRLFLPFVCSEYASVTGDYAIFDIRVPYLENREIEPGHDDVYYRAKHSSKDGTLYEHCIRAIKATCNFGKHDLPLMGTGDWNDGMDNVGANGGESVFLAFFLLVTIEKFMHICTKRNDAENCPFLRNTSKALRQATEKYAWDGQWYRRAYFADGTPLGSRENSECMIDLLSQVWGVFADRKRNPEKCAAAMQSAKELLRDETNGIIKLLTPPFSDTRSKNNAGYIESYADGVRENGGQYTHAAMWYLIALCMMGSDDEVMKTWDMLNPAKKDPTRYMAEPYVVAADVYSCPGYEGRGGWTWYTGSAAWAYIAAVRYILGMVKRGNIISFEPHNTWDEYEISYIYGKSTYNMHVVRNDDENSIEVDGKSVREIELNDDAKTHTVEIKYVPHNKKDIGQMNNAE